MVAVQHDVNGRTRILDAARRMFASRGFHQTPMAELAVAAEVSVGQIYRLFKSKQDVISALVQDDADTWCDQMADIQQRLDAGALTIEQTFEEMLLNATREKDEALAFDTLAESFRSPAVSDTIAAMCSRFRVYIRHFACCANDRLSGEALDAAEDLILACLFGVGHRNISRPRLTAENAAHWSARMIIAALRAN